MQVQKTGNQPSFNASLKVKAAKGMLTGDEIKALAERAFYLGKSTDEIIVNVGKLNKSSDSYGKIESYKMNVTTLFDGNKKEIDLSECAKSFYGQKIKRAFRKLDDFLYDIGPKHV